MCRFGSPVWRETNLRDPFGGCRGVNDAFVVSRYVRRCRFVRNCYDKRSPTSFNLPRIVEPVQERDL
jgi:hypothetical protein